MMELFLESNFQHHLFNRTTHNPILWKVSVLKAAALGIGKNLQIYLELILRMIRKCTLKDYKAMDNTILT